jgi:glycosyltransferase involved in cell wall biosynthesis
MRKKRILWVNEASWKGTGYSVYAHEVLSRLHKVEDFEVAELACYVDKNNPKIKETPWKVYPNRPLQEDPEFEKYVNNPSLVFGEQTFNEVCLHFEPDIVMDIRDWWMCEYQQRSPFRDFFHWALMPTVDAMPQNTQWINTFASADSVMAYSEFGKRVLEEQCDKIKVVGVPSPAANPIFAPVPDKKLHKANMGLDENSFIIGTVMRNQRRKLYPDLFAAFRQLLDATKNPDVFLYCHKYYPDIGWETPELLDRFGLNNRVLFTYKCTKCKNVSVNFFQDSVHYCDKCNTFTNKMVGIENSIDQKQLSDIYNIFDVYVQYANSEGFGMPQLEATSCGVPLISVNYSAMESVVKNVGGWPTDPIAMTMECETGCYRAIPNNDELVGMLRAAIDQKQALRAKGIQLSEQTKKQYNWNKTAQIWIDHIKSIPLKDTSTTWHSQPNIKTPSQTIPVEIKDLKDQVDYLFHHVLHKPEWIGGFLWGKVIKDCTFGYRVHNAEDDYYFNESHMPQVDKYEQFDYSKAAEEFIRLRNQWNQWEELRGKVMRGKHQL